MDYNTARYLLLIWVCVCSIAFPTIPSMYGNNARVEFTLKSHGAE
jgi:hypothetical protein